MEAENDVQMDAIEKGLLLPEDLTAYLVREDAGHPLVAGPKYRRLRAWIAHATAVGAKRLISAGGPQSNHLHGLACLAQEAGMPVSAYVRGWQSGTLTPLLADCVARGMEPLPISREAFDAQALGSESPILRVAADACFVPLGAGGVLGHEAMIAMTQKWLSALGRTPDWVALTAGTGTTLRGVLAAMPEQVRFFVAAPFKEPGFLLDGLTVKDRAHVHLVGSVDGKRFGKLAPEAREFALRIASRAGIVLDNLYMPTLLYQLQAQKALFRSGETVLILHCGGSPFTRLAER